MRYYVIYSFFCTVMYVARGLVEVFADSNVKQKVEAPFPIDYHSSSTYQSRRLLDYQPSVYGNYPQAPEFAQRQWEDYTDPRRSHITAQRQINNRQRYMRQQHGVPRYYDQQYPIAAHKRPVMKRWDFFHSDTPNSPSFPAVNNSSTSFTDSSNKNATMQVSTNLKPIRQLKNSPTSFKNYSTSAERPLEVRNRQVPVWQIPDVTADNGYSLYDGYDSGNPASEYLKGSRQSALDEIDSIKNENTMGSLEQPKFKRGYRLLPVDHNLYLLKEENDEPGRLHEINDQLGGINRELMNQKRSSLDFDDRNDGTSAMLAFKAHMHHDVRDIGKSFLRRAIKKDQLSSESDLMLDDPEFSSSYEDVNFDNNLYDPILDSSPTGSLQSVSDNFFPLQNQQFQSQNPAANFLESDSGPADGSKLYENNLYPSVPLPNEFIPYNSYQTRQVPSQGNYPVIQNDFYSPQNQPQEFQSPYGFNSLKKSEENIDHFEENNIMGNKLSDLERGTREDSEDFDEFNLGYLDKYARAVESLNDNWDLTDKIENDGGSLMNVEEEANSGMQVNNDDNNLRTKNDVSLEGASNSAGTLKNIQENSEKMNETTLAMVIEPLTAQLQKLLSSIKQVNEKLMSDDKNSDDTSLLDSSRRKRGISSHETEYFDSEDDFDDELDDDPEEDSDIREERSDENLSDPILASTNNKPSKILGKSQCVPGKPCQNLPKSKSDQKVRVSTSDQSRIPTKVLNSSVDHKISSAQSDNEKGQKKRNNGIVSFFEKTLGIGNNSTIGNTPKPTWYTEMMRTDSEGTTTAPKIREEFIENDLGRVIGENKAGETTQFIENSVTSKSNTNVIEEQTTNRIAAVTQNNFPTRGKGQTIKSKIEIETAAPAFAKSETYVTNEVLNAPEITTEGLVINLQSGVKTQSTETTTLPVQITEVWSKPPQGARGLYFPSPTSTTSDGLETMKVSIMPITNFPNQKSNFQNQFLRTNSTELLARLLPQEIIQNITSDGIIVKLPYQRNEEVKKLSNSKAHNESSRPYEEENQSKKPKMPISYSNESFDDQNAQDNGNNNNAMVAVSDDDEEENDTKLTIKLRLPNRSHSGSHHAKIIERNSEKKKVQQSAVLNEKKSLQKRSEPLYQEDEDVEGDSFDSDEDEDIFLTDENHETEKRNVEGFDEYEEEAEEDEEEESNLENDSGNYRGSRKADRKLLKRSEEAVPNSSSNFPKIVLRLRLPEAAGEPPNSSKSTLSSTSFPPSAPRRLKRIPAVSKSSKKFEKSQNGFRIGRSLKWVDDDDLEVEPERSQIRYENPVYKIIDREKLIPRNIDSAFYDFGNDDDEMMAYYKLMGIKNPPANSNRDITTTERFIREISTNGLENFITSKPMDNPQPREIVYESEDAIDTSRIPEFLPSIILDNSTEANLLENKGTGMDKTNEIIAIPSSLVIENTSNPLTADIFSTVQNIESTFLVKTNSSWKEENDTSTTIEILGSTEEAFTSTEVTSSETKFSDSFQETNQSSILETSTELAETTTMFSAIYNTFSLSELLENLSTIGTTITSFTRGSVTFPKTTETEDSSSNETLELAEKSTLSKLMSSISDEEVNELTTSTVALEFTETNPFQYISQSSPLLVQEISLGIFPTTEGLTLPVELNETSHVENNQGTTENTSEKSTLGIFLTSEKIISNESSISEEGKNEELWESSSITSEKNSPQFSLPTKELGISKEEMTEGTTSTTIFGDTSQARTMKETEISNEITGSSEEVTSTERVISTGKITEEVLSKITETAEGTSEAEKTQQTTENEAITTEDSTSSITKEFTSTEVVYSTVETSGKTMSTITTTSGGITDKTDQSVSETAFSTTEKNTSEVSAISVEGSTNETTKITAIMNEVIITTSDGISETENTPTTLEKVSVITDKVISSEVPESTEEITSSFLLTSEGSNLTDLTETSTLELSSKNTTEFLTMTEESSEGSSKESTSEIIKSTFSDSTTEFSTSITSSLMQGDGISSSETKASTDLSSTESSIGKSNLMSSFKTETNEDSSSGMTPTDGKSESSGTESVSMKTTFTETTTIGEKIIEVSTNEISRLTSTIESNSEKGITSIEASHTKEKSISPSTVITGIPESSEEEISSIMKTLSLAVNNSGTLSTSIFSSSSEGEMTSSEISWTTLSEEIFDNSTNKAKTTLTPIEIGKSSSEMSSSLEGSSNEDIFSGTLLTSTISLSSEEETISSNISSTTVTIETFGSSTDKVKTTLTPVEIVESSSEISSTLEESSNEVITSGIPSISTIKLSSGEETTSSGMILTNEESESPTAEKGTTLTSTEGLDFEEEISSITNASSIEVNSSGIPSTLTIELSSEVENTSSEMVSTSEESGSPATKLDTTFTPLETLEPPEETSSTIETLSVEVSSSGIPSISTIELSSGGENTSSEIVSTSEGSGSPTPTAIENPESSTTKLNTTFTPSGNSSLETLEPSEETSSTIETSSIEISSSNISSTSTIELSTGGNTTSSEMVSTSDESGSPTPTATENPELLTAKIKMTVTSTEALELEEEISSIMDTSSTEFSSSVNTSTISSALTSEEGTASSEISPSSEESESPTVMENPENSTSKINTTFTPTESSEETSPMTRASGTEVNTSGITSTSTSEPNYEEQTATPEIIQTGKEFKNQTLSAIETPEGLTTKFKTIVTSTETLEYEEETSSSSEMETNSEKIPTESIESMSSFFGTTETLESSSLIFTTPALTKLDQETSTSIEIGTSSVGTLFTVEIVTNISTTTESGISTEGKISIEENTTKIIPNTSETTEISGITQENESSSVMISSEETISTSTTEEPFKITTPKLFGSTSETSESSSDQNWTTSTESTQLFGTKSPGSIEILPTSKNIPTTTELFVPSFPINISGIIENTTSEFPTTIFFFTVADLMTSLFSSFSESTPESNSSTAYVTSTTGILQKTTESVVEASSKLASLETPISEFPSGPSNYSSSEFHTESSSMSINITASSPYEKSEGSTTFFMPSFTDSSTAESSPTEVSSSLENAESFTESSPFNISTESFSTSTEKNGETSEELFSSTIENEISSVSAMENFTISNISQSIPESTATFSSTEMVESSTGTYETTVNLTLENISMSSVISNQSTTAEITNASLSEETTWKEVVVEIEKETSEGSSSLETTSESSPIFSKEESTTESVTTAVISEEKSSVTQNSSRGISGTFESSIASTGSEINSESSSEMTENSSAISLSSSFNQSTTEVSEISSFSSYNASNFLNNTSVMFSSSEVESTLASLIPTQSSELSSEEISSFEMSTSNTPSVSVSEEITSEFLSTEETSSISESILQESSSIMTNSAETSTFINSTISESSTIPEKTSELIHTTEEEVVEEPEYENEGEVEEEDYEAEVETEESLPENEGSGTQMEYEEEHDAGSLNGTTGTEDFIEYNEDEVSTQNSPEVSEGTTASSTTSSNATGATDNSSTLSTNFSEISEGTELSQITSTINTEVTNISKTSLMTLTGSQSTPESAESSSSTFISLSISPSSTEETISSFTPLINESTISENTESSSSISMTSIINSTEIPATTLTLPSESQSQSDNTESSLHTLSMTSSDFTSTDEEFETTSVSPVNLTDTSESSGTLLSSITTENGSTKVFLTTLELSTDTQSSSEMTENSFATSSSSPFNQSTTEVSEGTSASLYNTSNFLNNTSVMFSSSDVESTLESLIPTQSITTQTTNTETSLLSSEESSSVEMSTSNTPPALVSEQITFESLSTEETSSISESILQESSSIKTNSAETSTFINSAISESSTIPEKTSEMIQTTQEEVIEEPEYENEGEVEGEDYGAEVETEESLPEDEVSAEDEYEEEYEEQISNGTLGPEDFVEYDEGSTYSSEQSSQTSKEFFTLEGESTTKAEIVSTSVPFKIIPSESTQILHFPTATLPFEAPELTSILSSSDFQRLPTESTSKFPWETNPSTAELTSIITEYEKTTESLTNGKDNTVLITEGSIATMPQSLNDRTITPEFSWGTGAVQTTTELFLNIPEVSGLPEDHPVTDSQNISPQIFGTSDNFVSSNLETIGTPETTNSLVNDLTTEKKIFLDEKSTKNFDATMGTSNFPPFIFVNEISTLVTDRSPISSTSFLDEGKLFAETSSELPGIGNSIPSSVTENMIAEISTEKLTKATEEITANFGSGGTKLTTKIEIYVSRPTEKGSNQSPGHRENPSIDETEEELELRNEQQAAQRDKLQQQVKLLRNEEKALKTKERELKAQQKLLEMEEARRQRERDKIIAEKKKKFTTSTIEPTTVMITEPTTIDYVKIQELEEMKEMQEKMEEELHRMEEKVIGKQEAIEKKKKTLEEQEKNHKKVEEKLKKIWTEQEEKNLKEKEKEIEDKKRKLYEEQKKLEEEKEKKNGPLDDEKRGKVSTDKSNILNPDKSTEKNEAAGKKPSEEDGKPDDASQDYVFDEDEEVWRKKHPNDFDQKVNENESEEDCDNTPSPNDKNLEQDHVATKRVYLNVLENNYSDIDRNDFVTKKICLPHHDHSSDSDRQKFRKRRKLLNLEDNSSSFLFNDKISEDVSQRNQIKNTSSFVSHSQKLVEKRFAGRHLNAMDYKNRVESTQINRLGQEEWAEVTDIPQVEDARNEDDNSNRLPGKTNLGHSVSSLEDDETDEDVHDAFAKPTNNGKSDVDISNLNEDDNSNDISVKKNDREDSHTVESSESTEETTDFDVDNDDVEYNDQFASEDETEDSEDDGKSESNKEWEEYTDDSEDADQNEFQKRSNDDSSGFNSLESSDIDFMKKGRSLEEELKQLKKEIQLEGKSIALRKTNESKNNRAKRRIKLIENVILWPSSGTERHHIDDPAKLETDSRETGQGITDNVLHFEWMITEKSVDTMMKKSLAGDGMMKIIKMYSNPRTEVREGDDPDSTVDIGHDWSPTKRSQDWRTTKLRHPPGSQWPTERTTKFHIGGTNSWDKEIASTPETIREERRADGKTNEKSENKESSEDDGIGTTCYTMIVRKGNKSFEKLISQRFNRDVEDQIELPEYADYDGRNMRNVNLKPKLRTIKSVSHLSDQVDSDYIRDQNNDIIELRNFSIVDSEIPIISNQENSKNICIEKWQQARNKMEDSSNLLERLGWWRGNSSKTGNMFCKMENNEFEHESIGRSLLAVKSHKKKIPSKKSKMRGKKKSKKMKKKTKKSRKNNKIAKRDAKGSREFLHDQRKRYPGVLEEVENSDGTPYSMGKVMKPNNVARPVEISRTKEPRSIFDKMKQMFNNVIGQSTTTPDPSFDSTDSEDDYTEIIHDSAKDKEDKTRKPDDEPDSVLETEEEHEKVDRHAPKIERDDNGHHNHFRHNSEGLNHHKKGKYHGKQHHKSYLNDLEDHEKKSNYDDHQNAKKSSIPEEKTFFSSDKIDRSLNSDDIMQKISDPIITSSNFDKGSKRNVVFQNSDQKLNISSIIPKVKNIVESQNLGNVEKIIVYVDKNERIARKKRKRSSQIIAMKNKKKGVSAATRRIIKESKSPVLSGEEILFDGDSLDEMISHVADKILKSVAASEQSSEVLDPRLSVKVIQEVANGTEIPHEETKTEFTIDLSDENFPQGKNPIKNHSLSPKSVKTSPGRNYSPSRLTSRSTERKMNLPKVSKKKRSHWQRKIKRENIAVEIKEKLMRELIRKLRDVDNNRIRGKNKNNLFGKLKRKAPIQKVNDIDEKIHILYALHHKKGNQSPGNSKKKRGNHLVNYSRSKRESNWRREKFDSKVVDNENDKKSLRVLVDQIINLQKNVNTTLQIIRSRLKDSPVDVNTTDVIRKKAWTNSHSLKSPERNLKPLKIEIRSSFGKKKKSERNKKKNDKSKMKKKMKPKGKKHLPKRSHSTDSKKKMKAQKDNKKKKPPTKKKVGKKTNGKDRVDEVSQKIQKILNEESDGRLKKSDHSMMRVNRRFNRRSLQGLQDEEDTIDYNIPSNSKIGRHLCSKITKHDSKSKKPDQAGIKKSAKVKTNKKSKSSREKGKNKSKSEAIEVHNTSKKSKIKEKKSNIQHIENENARLTRESELKNISSYQRGKEEDCSGCICDLEDSLSHLKKMLYRKNDLLNRIASYSCDKLLEIGDEIFLSPSRILNDVLPRSRRELAEAKGLKYIKPGDLEDVLQFEEVRGHEREILSFPGSDLHIPCSHEGEEVTWIMSLSRPNYTWIRSDDLPVSGTIRKNGNLELYDVDTRDAGNYSCIVSYIDPDNEELVRNVYEHRIQIVTLPRYSLRGGNHYEINECDEIELDMIAAYLPEKLNEILCKNRICDAFIFAPHCTRQQVSIKMVIVPASMSTLFPMGTTQCGLRCRKAVQDKVALLLSRNLRVILRKIITFRMPNRYQNRLVPMEKRFKDNEFGKRSGRNILGDADGQVGLLVGCPAGYGLKNSHCAPCSAGFHSQDLSFRCKRCSKGSYQPGIGARVCRICENPFVEGCYGTIWTSSLMIFLLLVAFIVIIIVSITALRIICFGKSQRLAGGSENGEGTDADFPLIPSMSGNLSDDDETVWEKPEKQEKKKFLKKFLGTRERKITPYNHSHDWISQRRAEGERESRKLEKVKTIPVCCIDSYRSHGGRCRECKNPYNSEYCPLKTRPPVPFPDFDR